MGRRADVVAYCWFWGGAWPISARSTTDLDAEADRSRCGVRPISV